MEVEVAGHVFKLLPQKAIYWVSERILLLADVHLGKINHFRKSGIPVPAKANDKNIEVMIDLVWQTKPDRIICLGDLFHSHYNPAWEVFGEMVKHFTSISFELVMGNHDIMSALQYQRKGIRVYDSLTLKSFLLTHHPLEEVDEMYYNLAGHIHPGVMLTGKGKQQITLPCFYFGKNQGVLPAFGMFTGLALVKPTVNDKIFVIAENKIITVS
jgi:uncharacterized protein